MRRHLVPTYLVGGPDLVLTATAVAIPPSLDEGGLASARPRSWYPLAPGLLARQGETMWTLLLFACLPLGTAALEISTALVLAVAILRPQRSVSPYVWPLVLLGLTYLASSLPDGPAVWLDAVGRLWPLALLFALPRLVSHEMTARVGLASAGLVAGIACVQAGIALSDGRAPESAGLFSHHLTLSYALIPPLAWALARGHRGVAGLLVIGVLATGSLGALLGLAVLAAALLWRPAPALIAGCVLGLAMMVVLPAELLAERAVLWASGAEVMADNIVGVGPRDYRDALDAAQYALSPGFHFPLHAHDAALQAGVLSGFVVWIPWVWLAAVLWRDTNRAGRAALAALAVGGLTQDTFGDLEVIRALCAWVLLGVEPRAQHDVE